MNRLGRLAVVLLFAASAAAEIPPVFFNNMNSCSSEPREDRVLGMTRFSWSGRDLYIVLRGNNYSIYQWRGVRFQSIDSSHFSVGNQGDSDYDLMNVAVCDDCRYGAASYKMALVIFDLGTGLFPDTADHVKDYNRKIIYGAATFSRGGKQYLVAESVESGCTQKSALYELVAENDLVYIECLSHPSGTARIVGGWKVGEWLITADKSKLAQLYKIVNRGGVVGLNYSRDIGTAYSIRGSAISIDREAEVMTIANEGGLTIYDVGALPATPVLGNVPGNWNRSSISGDRVFVARKGVAGSEVVFDITDPSTPVELSPETWAADAPQNFPGHVCAWIEGGALATDASALFTARYSVGQVWRTETWFAPEPAAEIFSDGFESGDSAEWSSVVN